MINNISLFLALLACFVAVIQSITASDLELSHLVALVLALIALFCALI